MYRSSMWSLGDAHFVDLPSIQCHRYDLCSYRFDATDHELNRTIICYKLNHCIEDDDFTLGVCIRCFPARRQFEQCFSYFDTGYAMLKKLCKAPTPINRRFTKEWESVLEASGFPWQIFFVPIYIQCAMCTKSTISSSTQDARDWLLLWEQIGDAPVYWKYPINWSWIQQGINTCPFDSIAAWASWCANTLPYLTQHRNRGYVSRKRPGAPFQNTCSL